MKLAPNEKRSEVEKGEAAVVSSVGTVRRRFSTYAQVRQYRKRTRRGGNHERFSTMERTEPRRPQKIGGALALPLAVAAWSGCGEARGARCRRSRNRAAKRRPFQRARPSAHIVGPGKKELDRGGSSGAGNRKTMP